jgi:hypothetical protein
VAFAFALAFVFPFFLKVQLKVLHIAGRYRDKIGSLNSGKHWERNHSSIPSCELQPARKFSNGGLMKLR